MSVERKERDIVDFGQRWGAGIVLCFTSERDYSITASSDQSRTAQLYATRPIGIASPVVIGGTNVVVFVRSKEVVPQGCDEVFASRLDPSHRNFASFVDPEELERLRKSKANFAK